MSQRRALSAAQVSTLENDGVHWVAPSLYLQIRSHGTRSWLFRYSRNRENQWMGLGAVSETSLTVAREEAALLRVKVRRGGDPMAERQQAAREAEATKPSPKVSTFAACAGSTCRAQVPLADRHGPVANRLHRALRRTNQT